MGPNPLSKRESTCLRARVGMPWAPLPAQACLVPAAGTLGGTVGGHTCCGSCTRRPGGPTFTGDDWQATRAAQGRVRPARPASSRAESGQPVSRGCGPGWRATYSSARSDSCDFLFLYRDFVSLRES